MNEHELAKLLRDNPDLRQANTKTLKGIAMVAAGSITQQEFREKFIPVNGNGITVTLPWPPSLNKMYKHSRFGVRLSAAATSYKAEVHSILRSKGHTQPTAEPCTLTIHQYRPRNAGDVDNYTKVLADALQGHLYENDKQIAELHIYQHTDKQNPRIEITVTRKEPK